MNATGSTFRGAGLGHPPTLATLGVVSVTVEGPNEGETRWTIMVDEDRTGIELPEALASAVTQCDDGGRGTIQLWIREVDPITDGAAGNLGFRRHRDLWQLRCALPNVESGLRTRPFTESDIEAFVGVNNRAFHWHPEQSGLTPEQVRETMAEPWFNADGFRLLHDDDNELIGFCWTKVHADTSPQLGEIYVIAVDPSQHGMGLGKPMTLAGLEWLTDQGLKDGMLYVESDNDPANATYSRIGFTRHHTDRAYRLER
ncbi:MAG: mycothiol synthase [Candidatus Aldehydirespiratoraceae bacterium]|jgi:mycothiol synthase